MKFSSIFAIFALTATAVNALPNPNANAEAIAVPEAAPEAVPVAEVANIEARGLSQTVITQLTTLLNGVVQDLQTGGNNILTDIKSILTILGTLNSALLGGGAVSVSASTKLQARGLSQTVITQLTTLLNGVIQDLQTGGNNILADVKSILTILGALNAALLGGS